MMTYADACHAMQSGVAATMAISPKSVSPKHLRVGINVALVNEAALVKLLIAKGVITAEEHTAAVTEGMNEEVARYERELGVTLL